MKIQSFSLGALLAVFTFVSAAQAAAQADVPVRIVTADMAYLYENYHSTQEAQSRFQSSIERAQSQTQAMMEEGQAMVEEYQEIIERTNNPALSEEARMEAQERAREMVEAIQQKERELQQFQNNTRRSLEQRQRNHRELMMEEIRDVVMAEARKRNATLVFDTSGPSAIGIPSVIYADPAYDITDIVLEEINRDASE